MSSTEQTGKIERAKQHEARKVSRRSFLRVSTFAGLTLFVGSMTAGFLGFFNLRSPKGFGRPVNVPKIQIPEPGGDPVRISEGRFWLVNLDGREGDVLEEGGEGGEGRSRAKAVRTARAERSVDANALNGDAV